MFNRLSEKVLGMALAAQSRTSRRRGLETLEWVLIGVCVVVAVYLSYKALGTAMKGWIDDTTQLIN